MPAFVEQELREFLACGVLASGFARFRCRDCAHEVLVFVRAVLGFERRRVRRRGLAWDHRLCRAALTARMPRARRSVRSSARAVFLIGIDTGGTFTDFVCVGPHGHPPPRAPNP